jgi:glycosyltransferase involved in cell wall biosynthesis
MKIEVLVATMYQKKIMDKYTEMNIRSDVVFSNQDDRVEYCSVNINGNSCKMITSAERGVGKNRNNAIMYSSGDVCLFSDDDLVYVDDYPKLVEEAFLRLPQAGIIVFNIEAIGKKESCRRNNKRIHRIRLHNVLNYGSPRIAIRRNEILMKNVWFSLMFGGGASFSCGEDSLFLVESLRKRIKIYAYPRTIAYLHEGNSSWFAGYNDKYFFDKGVWLVSAFPTVGLAIIISLYYSFKMSKSAGKNGFEIFSLTLRGIKNARSGTAINGF